MNYKHSNNTYISLVSVIKFYNVGTFSANTGFFKIKFITNALYYTVASLGLSLLCSKICLLCFLAFPKFSAYYHRKLTIKVWRLYSL